METINVLVTTKNRGVWYAQIKKDAELGNTTLYGLKNTVMVIRWGTEHGLQQLCNSGITSNTKISQMSDILVLHDVTAVFNVTDLAAEKIWNTNSK